MRDQTMRKKLHGVHDIDLELLLQRLKVPYVVETPKNYGEHENNLVIEPYVDIKVRDPQDPKGINFGLAAQVALYTHSHFVAENV